MKLVQPISQVDFQDSRSAAIAYSCQKGMLHFFRQALMWSLNRLYCLLLYTPLTAAAGCVTLSVYRYEAQHRRVIPQISSEYSTVLVRTTMRAFV